MITSFSKEVKDKLKHYVYRLIDPRNGKTFYVGEGCGDRVFAHANAVSKESFYKDNKERSDKSTDETDDPAKINTIMEIRKAGLPVIHMIQRHGMDQKTAFEVEAAFIDFFGLEQLTNKVKGHDHDRGMVSADEIEQRIKAPVFDDEKCPYPFILIKIKDYWINHNGGRNPDSIYTTTRGYWKININKANKYKYVLAVRYGIVEGVYQINKNGWKKDKGSARGYFEGIEASEDVKNYFMGKKIPEKYQRRQNPISYSK